MLGVWIAESSKVAATSLATPPGPLGMRPSRAFWIPEEGKGIAVAAVKDDVTRTCAPSAATHPYDVSRSNGRWRSAQQSPIASEVPLMCWG